MPRLFLNRRQNYGNRLLTERPGDEVGYLLPDGDSRFVRWLGFIEREAARELQGARPVRLVDITRIGEGDELAPRWSEMPPGHYVHGCLVARGVYAVYDTAVALVEGPKNGE